MTKTKNAFGQYVLTADKGKCLTDGSVYTIILVSNEDIDVAAWAEVDISEVPVDEEVTDTEALAELMEVLV